MSAENDGNSSIGSTVTNMVLWMFLPGFIAAFLHKKYYSFKYSRNSPRIPKPNSPKFRRHYRLCYTLVIGLYFLYCVGQSIYSLEESYYSKIGVKRCRVLSDIKRRTRQLLLTHHPDKSPTGDINKYHELKAMADTLDEPNLLNVYEKFGDSGVKTVRQMSVKKNYIKPEEVRKDYLYSTLSEWTMFYIGTVITSLLLSFGGKFGSGKYWRLVSLLLLAAFETYLYFVDFSTLESIHAEATISLLNPKSWILYLLSSVPIFHRIQVLRQIFIYSGFAISQLGPLWFPSVPDFFSDKKALMQEIESLEKLSSASLQPECSFVFNSAFEPFRDNEAMNALLKRKMGQVAVDLRVLESMTAESQGSENRKNR